MTGTDSGRGSVAPGSPFPGLSAPEALEFHELRLPVGALTAMRVRPATGPVRGTAVLVPGFTGSKEDFYPLLPLLAERGFDAWSYSQRGQADSTAPRGEAHYRTADFAGDAVEAGALIAEFTGSGPVHLLGHSFGGTVAQAAAIAGPDRFASLTLLCSGPHGWPDRKALEDRVLREAGPDADLWRLANPGVDPAGLAELPGLSEFDRFLAERSRRTSTDSLLGAVAALADPADRTFELAATGLPVLVAHGVDDNAWPIPWQRRQASMLRGRYAVIPDAGHLPNAENPVATADLLADFWGSPATG